jgi:hypothetical protein
MATYYWTGKVSSDVQNANNWSLWGPSSGVTLPASAASKPVDGSDVVLAKYPTTYPIFGPQGFLSGVSGGTLAVQLATLQVKEDFSKDIGTSSNYFKFFAKNVDLNKSGSGYTLAYIELTANPDGITMVEDPHAIVDVKCKTNGTKFYFKGTASSLGVISQPQFVTNAEIYCYNLTSSFFCFNPLSQDKFYLDKTTTNATVYSENGDDITNLVTQIFNGQSSLNISQGYQSLSEIYLVGNGTSINLTQTGVSGSNPLDLPYTLFTKLTVGVLGGPCTVNSYHETFIEQLKIEKGTINFYDPSSVSVITSGEFDSQLASLNTTEKNNLEIATLTIKNINGKAAPNIKLYGNYDITAYPNDPLA